MKRTMSVLCVVFFLVLGISTLSMAYNVTVNQIAGTTQTTTALTGYSTIGDMMDGMAVTAYFSNGDSQAATWADTGASSGAATGTGWSLSQIGDTFSSPWTLSSTGASLAGFMIDAGVGNTVFDRYFGDNMGTDGSARGKDFAVQSAGSGDITATYSGMVALTGFAPVGDLFRYLIVDFGFNFGTAASLTFVADTDNILYAGDINPVPEPATLLLLGAGLIGLAGYGRKKFN